VKELDILLEKYWILKDQDKELYYRLRDAAPRLRPFLTEKLGYQIIVTPQLIKLEKLPGKLESWMGIESFDDNMEYCFLCLMLMFLEDKGKEEQFLLSEVTEFIEGTFPGDEKIDWTLYRHRRHLIKVLRFIIDIGMVRVNDGDEQGFANAQDVEVLYENTGVSMYFMRNFIGNIVGYSDIEDFENDEWIDVDKDRGRIRRNRVYRRIIMSPAIYSEGVDDADYLYIKNYRNMIQNDIEKYFQSEFHVHKNGAFLVLSDDKNYKNAFPEHKTISDIVLQMNKLIVEKVEGDNLNKAENDVITISKQYFDKLVNEVREKNVLGWSKEYREMKVDKLCDELIKYMKSFSMIQIDEKLSEVKIMPLVGKIIGRYPADFINTSEEGVE